MNAVQEEANDYVTRVFTQTSEIAASAWDALVDDGAPFMRHTYLHALQASGSAAPPSGWGTQFLTLWRGGELQAACPLYLKAHSFGEYVFDWAWAEAYQRHGLAYYPKALVAVPFTPVPGPRLLARDAAARTALVAALLAFCRERKLSSLHLLFGSDADIAACQAAGMLLRHGVQFHWENRPPQGGAPWPDFDAFLASLSQEKRKKIRQERRKVAEAGVRFRWSRGADITPADWEFFYRCYERTYHEHGNPPYLTREFFARMARQLPQHWLLFVAERAGRPIASSLIGLGDAAAYGRYWGALERLDCLHFEACYYQPIEWCLAHGIGRFEGGAQGEHKMARALLPVRTTSAHWLAHPAFAGAVQEFLVREGQGMEQYLAQLHERSPFRQAR